MDDENNANRSESTEENEERSETETECFDKPDSDILSQNESTQESRCRDCRINFQNNDDLKQHKIQKHPLLVYKCIVGDCIRWFPSRKNRDKHSENLKSRLHKSAGVKSPPPNAIFIEDASEDQLDVLKKISNDYNRNKSKRGPKPKLHFNENDKDFLVGLPRDQLKRKLMESVVEKIEATPAKKINQINDNSTILNTKSSKRRSSFGQMSQTSSINTGNVSSPKSVIGKGIYYKNNDNQKNSTLISLPKFKPIPDLSHIKVPLLSLDTSFSIEKFAEDLINLLIMYDPAEYFKNPLIDHFAPLSAQIIDQIDMKIIVKNLKEGNYSKNLESLQGDLLLLYSNGLHSFEEKSIGWCEAAKLYQTTLVNMQNAKKQLYVHSDPLTLNDNLNGNTQLKYSQNIADDRSTYLNIMNPYNNGKISENERIITIGDQLGKLKSGTQNLLGYKEDRRNKVTVLSYLDYGANFSFGPSYDSGNAYSSKETSDLLIRAYGDGNYLEESQFDEELNEIIPEFTLGDDFSLYLMNTFTRDIIKSFQAEESKPNDNITPLIEISVETNESSEHSTSLQTLLDDSWKDLAKLRSSNYERLSNYQLQPSNLEQTMSEKVTANLTNLILKTNPESVANMSVIRKVLNCP